MTTNAWYALTIRLGAAEATYRRLAQECFDRNDFQNAARWKGVAEGISYTNTIQHEIAAEEREKAVGSATQQPSPDGTPLT